MRLATIRHESGTAAGLVADDVVHVLDFPSVKEVLEQGLESAEAHRTGEQVPVAGADFAPVIPVPSATWCVGLNYAGHAEETGVDLPEFPTVFSKMAGALIGARDNIVMPPPDVSVQLDWETELVLVIGRECRFCGEAEAEEAIAGYTVGNDISVRDWQLRTTQWLLGKTLERSSPVGPWMVTKDEFGSLEGKRITCEVNGETVQSSQLGDLHFKPAELVACISQMISLRPGDLIFTGTPSGVALSHPDQPWLTPGSTVRTHIDGLGDLENVCALP